MKKSIITMFVTMMVLCSSLFAQNLVYDYKASIKRLDPVFSVKSQKGGKFVASSYKVASDTITGYIVLPVCVGCNDNGIESSLGDDNTGVGYFVRKGDKLSSKYGVPYILKTGVDVTAGIFGAYKNCQDPTGEPLTSVKLANKAWMALDYDLPNDATVISSKSVLKNVIEEDLPIGFLGLTNINGLNATIQHTGFGTAKVQSFYQAAELGWCATGEDVSKSCQFVNSIAGTLVGYPRYIGLCGTTPMWDVCYDKVKNPYTINDSVICGSWTLKFNATVTKAYNAADGADKKQAVILAKFKATAKQIIDENYNYSSSDDE